VPTNPTGPDDLPPDDAEEPDEVEDEELERLGQRDDEDDGAG